MDLEEAMSAATASHRGEVDPKKWIDIPLSKGSEVASPYVLHQDTNNAIQRLESPPGDEFRMNNVSSTGALKPGIFASWPIRAIPDQSTGWRLYAVL